MIKKPTAEDLAAGLHLASPAALAARLSGGKYRRARHLDYLSDKLVDIATGSLTRLMVLMPPRHGKSECVSNWFPAWALALQPWLQLMLACYGHDFARTWGVKVRNTVRRNWPELGITLSEDTRAGHRWQTMDGGGMETTGVGGEFTGKGGQILIVDDPTKNAEEAASEIIQRRNWEWWRSTFRTRLTPTELHPGAIVVVGTPWDDNDLIGQLLRAHAEGPTAEGYEPWTVVRFPAVATEADELGRAEDDALWPDVFDREALRQIEVSVGPYWWEAQYQGHPRPRGGDLIKETWWNYWVPPGMGANFPPVVVDGRVCRVVELPMGLAEFQSWDMNFRDSVRAIEEGRQPDAVAGQTWARDDADLYLKDRFWGRVGLDATIIAVREMSARNPKATTKLVEDTANGPAVMAKLNHELGGFIPVSPKGSKKSRVIGDGRTANDRGARAISMQAFVKAGNVYLPHPAYRTWTLEFRRNLGKFPKDGKDDTDAASQAWAYAQSNIWKAQDLAQYEAQRYGPPPKTTKEILQREWNEHIKQERRALSPRGPQGRRAFYRRPRRFGAGA